MLYKTGVVLSLLLIYSCNPQTASEKYFSDRFSENEISQIVDRPPSTDTLQTLLISETILRAGSPAVTSVCRLLSPQNKELKARAEYVLAGLNNYVTQAGFESQRKKFLDGIYKALEETGFTEAKVLLFSLLQTSGDETTVAVLKPYLTNDDLCLHACRTLVAIGSEQAAQLLHTQLKENKAADPAAFIKALGDLQYQAAGADIFKLTDSEDNRIQQSAHYALARIGYPPAGTGLQNATLNGSPLERQAAVDLYLTWLKNQNDNDLLISACREIIADNDHRYNDQSKLAALHTLVSARQAAALPEVLGLVRKGDRKARFGALEMTYGMPDASVTRGLIDLLKDVSAEIRSEIIYTLGRRGEKEALEAVSGYLTDDSSDVRSAAVISCVQIGHETAVPQLLNALYQNTSPADQNLLKQALLDLPVSSYSELFENPFGKAPVQTKITVLELIAERHISGQIQLVMTMLAEDSLRVRLAALNTLSVIAGSDQIQPLLKFLLENNDSVQKRAAAETLAEIAGKEKDRTKRVEQFVDVYPAATTDDRTYLLSILKKLAGNEALHFVQRQSETAGSNEEREAALRTLVTWPGSEAVEPLITLAGKSGNQTHRILAIRGCLQLLGENDLGSLYETDICQRLMKSANRQEEKQMILAALGSIRSAEAMTEAATHIADPALAIAAVKAVETIADNEDKEIKLTSTQVAAAMVNAWPGYHAVDSTGTSTQIPEGFTALFNGVDLSGWKGLVANPVKRAQMSTAELAAAQTEADQMMREHWHVINGILCFDGKGHSLCTGKDYRSFELLVDWKIGPDGDSGIYLRGSPQVQIWDPLTNPVGSGGLYNNQIGSSIPLQVADNPVGQWNRFRIIMQGRYVTVYLNKRLVVDHVILENYWERDKPIYATGQIELQAHNSPLYFKNIYIRELPDEPAPFDGPLFNGKDLDGWEIISKNKDNWQVGDDGILFTEGTGGGWISTTREFADFKLDLEFRLPEGGNSGVFIRTPREGNPAYVGMEIQVLDDYAQEYADLKPWQYTGSIYAVLAPSKRVTRPANQWQQMTIDCRGPRVQVIVNGEMTIDANLIDFMDKIREHPGLKRREGYIGLQSHSTKIEYRNIYLREY